MIKKKKKKEVPIKRVTRPQCHLVADPHAYGFNGKNFEAQVEGDWILYKGLNMECFYRGKRFAGQGWVANQKFGVVVYGQKIVSINVGDVHNLIIDDERKTINGRFNLHRGGYVIVAGNKVTIGTGDGEEVDFVVGYMNNFDAYVRSNVPTVSGLCSQQFEKAAFFDHPMEGKVEHIEIECHGLREQHTKFCHGCGLQGQALKNCVMDRCQGLGKKNEERIMKDIHHEKKS